MAYDPTTWKTGDKITAEKLNNIESGIGEAIELPEVTATNNGKILGVVEGEWTLMDAPIELPAVTAENNGKVLGVVNGAWALMSLPIELPAASADDNGKVLGIVNGAWALMSLPAASDNAEQGTET